MMFNHQRAPLIPVVLDNAVLSELKEFSDEDDRSFFKDQVEIFLRRGSELTTDIAAYARAEAFTEMRRRAHALAGSAASIGAIRLRDLCLHLERREALRYHDVADRVEDIDEEFLKVAATIKTEVTAFYAR